MPLTRNSVHWLALLIITLSGPAMAQGAAPESPSPSVKATASPAPSAKPAASAAPAASATLAPSPEVLQQLEKTKHIQQLLKGELDVGIEPATLFEVSLDNEQAIAVEISRLEAIKARAKFSHPVQRDKDQELALRFEARLALDLERLTFLDRPEDERTAILKRHATKQALAADAEERLKAAELERQRREAAAKEREAREAIKRATSSADRLLKLEEATLATLKKSLVDYEQGLARKHAALTQHQEDTLSLRGNVREFMVAAPIEAEPATKLFTEVRMALAARSIALRKALGEANTPPKLPIPGRTHLGELSPKISTPAVKKKRRALEKKRRTLLAESRALAKRATDTRLDWVNLLHAEVFDLNTDRLVLLSVVSRAKRAAITGFGKEGRSEALNEFTQVSLMLRYDYEIANRWLREGRLGQQFTKLASWKGSINAISWLLPFVVFFWWRRRSQRALDALASRNKSRSGLIVNAPRLTVGQRAARFLARVHVPLEWLLLLWSVVSLLPEQVQSLLELKVVTTIFSWTLGGRLVIDTIDYLASHENDPWHKGNKVIAPVRLRSLLLAGRVIVTLGLILALSEHLVGRGTIYSWVFRLCWFAAIPVVLTVVHWWRAIIFEHVNAKATRSMIDVWVANNETGGLSLAAAIVGGSKLLITTIYRGLRNWLGSFDSTRIVMAYFFQRGMSKQADEKGEKHFQPIDHSTYEALGPRARACCIVPSVADSQVADIIERIDKPGGGVFAIVGERGQGKSTLLARIAEEANDVTVVRCPFGGMDAFNDEFTKAFGGGRDLEEVATRFHEAKHDAGVLIDDAHRLIQPMMGGLKDFDRLLDNARRHSEHMTWVFAFDDVIWRFFERMRGSRPLFDEVIRLKPWLEEGIANLLRSRSKNTEVDPCFEHIVGGFHPDVDAFDRNEALKRTEASYFRLIWSYAAGNPGVALHAWRTSLGLDSNERTSVRIFQAPDTDELDALPDPAVFVLRAIVQLEHATVEDLCLATGLPAPSVQDALRYGLVRGYFHLEEKRYRIRWTWFRAITRFLQRRHLLFAGSAP